MRPLYDPDHYRPWPLSWLLADATHDMIITGNARSRVCHKCNKICPTRYGFHWSERSPTNTYEQVICCQTCWGGCGVWAFRPNPKP